MSKTFYYSSIIASSSGLVKLISFLILFWLARDLSVDEYAKFGLFYSMQLGIVAFSISGIIESATGFLKSNSINSIEKLFFNSKIVFLLYFSIIFLVLSTYYYLFLDKGIVFFAVIYCSLILSYCSLQFQLLRLDEKHIKSIIFSFLVPVVGILGAFIMYYKFRAYGSYFYGSSIGLTISIFFLLITQKFNFNFEIGLLKKIMVKSVPFIFVAFIGWISGYGNLFIINFFLDNKSVAAYTFLMTIGSAILILANSLNQVWAPRVYKLISNSDFIKVEKESSIFYGKMSLIIAIVSSFIIISYPYVLDLIGGNLVNYKDFQFELMLIFLSYLTLTSWWNSYNYFLYFGKGKLVFKIVIISSSIGLFIWVLLIYFLKDIGVYIGFLIQMMLRALVINIYSKQLYNVNYNWLYLLLSFCILISTYFSLKLF